MQAERAGGCDRHCLLDDAARPGARGTGTLLSVCPVLTPCTDTHFADATAAVI